MSKRRFKRRATVERRQASANRRQAKATKKLSRGPATGRGAGDSREETPKQSKAKSTSPTRVQAKDGKKRGRPSSEPSPDSPPSSSDKPPPRRTRSRKKKEDDNPAALLAEMKDLEKRLRATVGGTACPDADFKRMVEHLKTVCPGPKQCKIVVTRCDPEEMDTEHGTCSKDKNVFTIEINKALNEYETEHVLIHEWAHMLAWRPYHPLMGDHGSDWGVWYAMVWRKYHGVE